MKVAQLDEAKTIFLVSDLFFMFKKESLFIQILLPIINIKDYKFCLNQPWYNINQHLKAWGHYEVFVFRKITDNMFLLSNRYTYFQLHSIQSVPILKFKSSVKIKITYLCIKLNYGCFQIIQCRKPSRMHEINYKQRL